MQFSHNNAMQCKKEQRICFPTFWLESSFWLERMVGLINSSPPTIIFKMWRDWWFQSDHDLSNSSINNTIGWTIVHPSLEFVIGRWMDERCSSFPWVCYWEMVDERCSSFPLRSLGDDRWYFPFPWKFVRSRSMNNVRSSIWVELIDEKCSFFPLELRWSMKNVRSSLWVEVIDEKCFSFHLSWADGWNSSFFPWVC